MEVTPLDRRLKLIAPFVLAFATACGGGSDSGSGDNPAPADPPMFANMNVVRHPMAATQPAVTTSPHAAKLRDCVFSNTRSTSCTLGDLPLLGGETDAPTIDDVMDRVLVSHPWMGVRFREVLEALPDDMRLMLRAVTAVVISSDVRPSFYWTRTGAIYLDPETLWLTPAEQAVIPDTPDFRSGFGSDLQFAIPWRWVKDNNYASPSTTPGASRTLDDILLNIGALLYHELAHANDFFPPEQQRGLSSTLEIWRTTARPSVSDDLESLMPLQSDILVGLARVRFHGDTATATQRGYTPADVAGFFKADTATAFYNYSTTREDLAMLFESVMLRARFGVERDIAVTNNPQGDDVTGADYIVEWGQRNRVGDAAIKERARYAVARLLPEVSLDAYIDAMPGPREMRQGENWLQNLDLDPSVPGAKSTVRHPPVQELPGYH